MKRWILFIAAVVQMNTALFVQAEPLSTGQIKAESFLRGNFEGIWEASTSEMRGAFGSIRDLSAFHQRLLHDFGREEVVLSESVNRQSGHDVYVRLSRWSDSPALIEFVIALDDAEQIAGFLIRPQPVAAPSSYMNYETKAELRLPVEGEWYIYWGGRKIEDNYHAIDPGQRFALDLLVFENGRSYVGDAAILANYHCWGRPILAPAHGVVVRSVDGLPDQEIGNNDPRNQAGNHVVIDFGNNEYGFLAHLRQDSIRVSNGDRIVAGQEIGLCGNSGNTSEPHLHFHIQTTPTLGRGDGLPAQFQNYQANGVLIKRGEPARGETVLQAD